MKAPAWCSSRVKAELAETRLSEHLENIHQKPDVGTAVQVAVVPQGLAPKGRPDLLRVGVVRLVDVLIRKLAVEGPLRVRA